ncbi:GGDEF domain-containing protein [Georhizobium profundi]|uniref:diguanylate cyclase n=1 Tax=Georhizobium profundi TaxID=2341112 RepID=A0A3S9B4X5_9HYPH|nr:GGDEF domain-containing protein [Georhizobium profundi]AZN71969.1 GGDEF domain-containing protein [Georhizobium profundi]
MNQTARRPAPGDIATRIAISMRRLNIPGLPRNYELVYEAFAGSDPALTRAFVALGTSPTQADLDALGRQFLVHHHGQGIVADAQETISRNIEECLQLLRREQSKLENYGRTLGRANAEMVDPESLRVDIIRNFITILTTATDSTISDSRTVINGMVGHASEITRVRNELDEYKRMAHTDVMTQLSNRRAFDDMMAQIYSDQKSAMYFALVIADIDKFKRINDTFGHPVGDKVIKLIGSLFRAALRKDVFIARTGGEEFGFILAGTTAAETMSIANRIRTTVEQTPFVNQRTGTDYGPVTLSMGVCMAADAENESDLYRKADAALYASKNAGRNRVTMHMPGADGELSEARAMYRKISA